MDSPVRGAPGTGSPEVAVSTAVVPKPVTVTWRGEPRELCRVRVLAGVALVAVAAVFLGGDTIQLDPPLASPADGLVVMRARG